MSSFSVSQVVPTTENSFRILNTSGKRPSRWHDSLSALSHFLHRHLLWLLIAAYALAAIRPGFGLWMRDVSVWHMNLFHENSSISVPMILLAFLLFNAGLGLKQLPSLAWLRKGAVLGYGTLGNLLIPLAFILVVSQAMHFWHNPDEAQNILVGLALIASMPIAGSSTAWAQNSDGDMSVSLGLVLLTTFLSPITTPIILRLVGFMTTGTYSANLHELAQGGTGSFLMFFVMLPSLAGLLARTALGWERAKSLKNYVRIANMAALLLLSYSNAAVSLPKAFAKPDADFLVMIVIMVASLCILAFGSGWLIARLAGADRGQESALMFGLGMNNNGTGLVLASATLAHYPMVMVPIIFYNLVQHLIAGGVDHLRYRNSH
jgi:BASS family bile acid:Na+ symporter